jgi:HlyD family secretion protein
MTDAPTRRPRFLPFLVVLGAAAIMSYFFFWPLTVPSITVAPEMASQTIVGPGIFDARLQVGVASKVAGFLELLTVDRNDNVTEGQIIAKIDDHAIALAVAAAEARLRAATAMRLRARTEGQRAQALLEQASTTYDRQSRLFDQGAIAQAAFDQVRNAFEVADLAALEAGAGLAEAEAGLEAAEADLRSAEAQLADTTIHAPLTGTVTTRHMTPGELVSPGMPLLQIVDPSSIVVLARFDESTISLIRPGQIAKVIFGTSGEAPVSGTVALVSREVDVQTREYIVDIRLDALPDNWAIGRRVTVEISAPHPAEAILVPQDMIARRDGKVGLWLARNGHARWAEVQLGYLNGTRVAIAAGLDNGDVVVDPAGLFPWRRIEPMAQALVSAER